MFGRMRWRLSWLYLGPLVVGAAIAGCGGDEGDSTAKDKIKFTAASESADVFVERMAKLLETTNHKRDCPQLEEINQRSATRFPCPPSKDVRKSMARFEIVGHETYGTGAVVDYRSGEAKDGAAIVLFVGKDRNWAISRFGVFTKPSTKTSDENSREGYDKALAEYLTAVRKRDCATLEKVAFTDAVEERDVCQVSLAGTAQLAKRLKSNPAAKPKYEGGNATYGFYTLETQEPRPENSTIGLLREPGEPPNRVLVLDVTPSPTAAEQRQVIREYRQQQREKSSSPGGGMQPDPSSKPLD